FSAKARQLNVDLIKETVSDQFNIKLEDFNSKKRTRAISYPRQIAMYLSRELTDLSLPKIGEEFGGRDHTTVIHAYDKITKDMEEDAAFKEKIETIIKELKNE
ncbi:MAG TPA: helix-turn-helix domain-containing protein, partial [Clostridia bacterium]|nr:helix-turn-helix domain-containing protein [Clostridia bacterium]